MKIELFVRHCNFSEISAHKHRFSNFSRKKCHDNLLATLDRSRVNVTFLLDTFFPSPKPHFVLEQTDYPVVTFQGGSEAISFLTLLDYVSQLKLHPQTILYFLEDDYLHRPGWVDILLEGFSLPQASYITLYDHSDKYAPAYHALRSQLFCTRSCHWRTTPSTTNTYAMRYGTLLSHLSLHRSFSEGRKISSDHAKFMHLQEKEALLLSSIPGWSTHVELEYASPCISWTFPRNEKG